MNRLTPSFVACFAVLAVSAAFAETPKIHQPLSPGKAAAGSKSASAAPSFKIVSRKTTKPHIYTAELSYPRFSGGPKMAELNRLVAGEASHSLHAWLVGGGSTENTWNHRLNAFQFKVDPVTAYPGLVSLVAMVYSDTGGAHPVYAYQSTQWHFAGGKWIKIHAKDLFKPGSDWLGEIRSALDPMLRAKGANFLWDETVKTLPEADADVFLITKAGLKFYTSPYEVGPWAQGSFITTVPFAKLPSLNPDGPLKALLGKN